MSKKNVSAFKEINNGNQNVNWSRVSASIQHSKRKPVQPSVEAVPMEEPVMQEKSVSQYTQDAIDKWAYSNQSLPPEDI